MARLLGIRIKNYRVLADFALGQSKYGQGEPLPRLVCLIGPNGAGKSTVLDAFGFLADSLTEGVEAACDKPHRGGFERLRTQGQAGPIEFEIFFEDDSPKRPIAYELHVDLVNGVPAVVHESLRQRQAGSIAGAPYHFLKLTKGKGKVWKGKSVDIPADRNDSEQVKLAEQNKLGIASLGNLATHPRIVRLREYIENWYLSYFVPNAARALPASGAQRWLDREGSNIGNVLQYFQRQHKDRFGEILKRLAKSVPGIKKLSTEESLDKRLLLKFDEQGYKDPFYQQSMSDGTLKMLAYATLLEDPDPRPFIGIEEPENGLYVQLVEGLARDLAARADGKAQSTQLLVTTHSPYFVDALEPKQVWLIRKQQSGHATALHASDLKHVVAMKKEGIPLGSLWYSNHFVEDGS